MKVMLSYSPFEGGKGDDENYIKKWGKVGDLRKIAHTLTKKFF